MPEKKNNILDSIFGASDNNDVADVLNARNNNFQSWLNTKKKAVEAQRKESVDIARYNALGNVLTAMAQPIAWKQGGATVAAPAPDQRQYLESFNKAVKANEDLRNIGDMEAEYQFKLADDNYRRELAIANEERKARMNAEIQAEYAKQRHDYTMEEIEARGEQKLDIERLKQQYRVSKDGKYSKDLQQIFYERAATAWANYVSDYRKKSAVGNIELKPMMTQDEFLKDFALKEGYSVNSSGMGSGSASASAASTGRRTAPLGSTAGKSGRSTAKL